MMKERSKKTIVAILILILLMGFFFWAKKVSPDYLQRAGLALPLIPFTLTIALVDGFNPCSIWALSFLLILLISVSHSRKRIFAVGYSFVFTVLFIYFLFMAAWLKIYSFITCLSCLRIGVASIALIVGGINIKDYFFFKKGLSLTIRDKDKISLAGRMHKMRETIKKGNFPALIFSSIALAVFTSFIELPCTAGFPVIYVGILSQQEITGSISFYIYLLLYCLIYTIPLSIIVFTSAYFLKRKQISELQVRIVKLAGGIIMVILGIALLVRLPLLLPLG